jgi:hypothetical protein
VTPSGGFDRDQAVRRVASRLAGASPPGSCRERRNNVSAKRYEISVLIGPCLESEAETLCLELADHIGDKRGEMGSVLGACLSVGPWDEQADAERSLA